MRHLQGHFYILKRHFPDIDFPIKGIGRSGIGCLRGIIHAHIQIGILDGELIDNGLFRVEHHAMTF